MRTSFVAVLAILAVSFVTTAQAQSFVVFPSVNSAAVPISAQVKPVFSDRERAELKALYKTAKLAGQVLETQVTNALVVEIENPSDALAYERALKRAGQVYEYNAAPTLQEVSDQDLGALQWGIENSGTGVEYAVTGFQRLKIPGTGRDSGATRVGESAAAIEVPVAVLDSGVDVNHVRLKDRIFRNEKECAVLESHKTCRAELKAITDTASPAYQAKAKACLDLSRTDADGNGYAMDCMGWNPADATVDPVTKVRGTNDVTDRHGHGTFVSGIIAGNGFGTGPRGVTATARIIPVRVIDEDPNSPAKPQAATIPLPTEDTLKAGRALSDVVARGILYAIRSGARVINMSIAWPWRSETPLNRSLVQLALSQGIVIVAAAGNDATEARVFPCMYEGVICVGAHGPDDGLSHFSNYGPAVDLAAPGISIISSIPEAIRSRLLLRTGYEVKDGTSFGAPFVAGGIARLLSDGMSSQEAMARLLVGTRRERVSTIENPKAERKFTVAGLMDLELARNAAPQSLVRPMTKTITRLTWDGTANGPTNSAAIPFEIRFQNQWEEAAQVKMSLKLRTQGLEIVGGPVVNKTELQWKSGEIRTWPLQIRVTNPRLDDMAWLDVTVDDGVKMRTYRVALEIGMAIGPQGTGHPLARSLPIAAGAIPAGAKLWSISSRNLPELRDYFAVVLRKPTTTGQPLELDVTLLSQGLALTDISSSYRARGMTTLKLDGAPSLETVSRMDLNRDGQLDYLLEFKTTFPPVAPEKKSRTLYDFYAFDANMKPLSWAFDGGNRVTHVAEFTDLSENFKMAAVENRLMPAWVAVGYVPTASQKPASAWNKPEGRGVRLYTITRKGLIEVRPAAVAGEPASDIANLLAPNVEQEARGVLPVLVRREQSKKDKLLGIPERYWIGELSNGTLSKISDLNSSASNYFTLYGLPNTKDIQVSPSLNSQGTAYIADGASGESDVITLVDQHEVQGLRLRAPAPVESVVGVSGVFLTERSGSRVIDAFSQTQYGLMFHDGRTGESRQISMRRMSFLPSAASSRTVYPILLRDGNSMTPAVFVQNGVGAVVGMEVFVPEWDAQGSLKGITRPAALHLEPAKGCEDMANIIESSDVTRAPEIAYFCGDHFVRIGIAL